MSKDLIMKSFKKYFSLNSIVPAITIGIAAVAINGIQIPGLATDKIILLLLGLLAIDALIIQVEGFDSMNRKINLITNNNKGTRNIRNRADESQIQNYINDAKKEICISGIALDSTARQFSFFDKFIKNGGSIYIVSINPDIKLVKETAAFLGEMDDIIGRLNDNLLTLYKNLKLKYSKKVKIHTIDFRPSVGYFIVDPKERTGLMTIETYLCDPNAYTRPFLELKREDDIKWFNKYYDDFNKIWEKSSEWNPDRNKVEYSIK